LKNKYDVRTYDIQPHLFRTQSSVKKHKQTIERQKANHIGGIRNWIGLLGREAGTAKAEQRAQPHRTRGLVK
jgi:hypothetical protein